jgi:hypothetical protein
MDDCGRWIEKCMVGRSWSILGSISAVTWYYWGKQQKCSVRMAGLHVWSADCNLEYDTRLVKVNWTGRGVRIIGLLTRLLGIPTSKFDRDIGFLRRGLPTKVGYPFFIFLALAGEYVQGRDFIGLYWRNHYKMDEHISDILLYKRINLKKNCCKAK